MLRLERPRLELCELLEARRHDGPNKRARDLPAARPALESPGEHGPGFGRAARLRHRRALG